MFQGIGIPVGAALYAWSLRPSLKLLHTYLVPSRFTAPSALLPSRLRASLRHVECRIEQGGGIDTFPHQTTARTTQNASNSEYNERLTLYPGSKPFALRDWSCVQIGHHDLKVCEQKGFRRAIMQTNLTLVIFFPRSFSASALWPFGLRVSLVLTISVEFAVAITVNVSPDAEEAKGGQVPM